MRGSRQRLGVRHRHCRGARPRALALYGRSGFALRPAFCALGPIDRRLLPAPDAAVREGGEDDFEELATISREVRGAPHTAELRYALGRGAALLVIARRGFAVAAPEQGLWLLVARDDAAATALLWGALARVHEGKRARVGWITAEQGWAIDVALRAGLELTPHGALGVRGNPGPLRPFLPSAPFA